MNKIVAILALGISISCGPQTYHAKTGDILFQDLNSPSSGAIKTASDSPYSHCGLVSVENGTAYVIEAVGPVRKISLDEWIADGGGRYTAARLKKSGSFDCAVTSAEGYMGRPYDILYEWDDAKIYCSELVYKAFENGCGIELCALRPFESYNLGPVRQAVMERYGRIPDGLKVVTPGDLARSDLVKVVYSNMPH